MASTPTEIRPRFDPDPTTGEITRVDPIDSARLAHERLLAMLGVGASIIGAVTVAFRIQQVEAWAGWRIMALCGVAFVVMAGRLIPYFHTAAPWKPWARTTFEVTICSLVILLDAMVGPEFLISGSTGYLHVLCVTMCSLRLRPAVSLYAAGMAILQHGIIYLWAFQRLVPNPDIPDARHYQELAFRLAVIGLIGGVGILLARTLSGAANEERIRNAFGSYVDSRVVRRVLRGDLRLEPERRTITVLFVDIRGFTAIAEAGEPLVTFRRLNTALETFANEVQMQGGIVNKFLGDGLLALFGAPEPQDDHARRAVRCALRLVSKAERMAGDGRFPGLKIGVGIHTGDAIVGDIGGARREFTAVGDVVNVASRVEAMTKELQTPILITDEVRKLIGAGAELRGHAPVELRGRSGKMILYSVESLQGTANIASLSGEHKPAS